jgi:hypothetical protein
MPPALTIVIIGVRDALPALCARFRHFGRTLPFSDGEIPQALAAIVRRPHLVVLDQTFASTSRGVTLIGRIKADRMLEESELRIVSRDGREVRVATRPATPVPEAQWEELSVETVEFALTPPVIEPPPAEIDQHGTRRARRYRVAGKVDLLVNGNPGTPVDISIIGVQVISPTVLRPNQRVRMTLVDDYSQVRLDAAIAWSAFELPSLLPPHYRAGVEFSAADPTALRAFCSRHASTE